MEIDGKRLHIAAFQAPDFTRPIDWRTLPERVQSEAATLVRADLVKGGIAPVEPLTREATVTGALPAQRSR